MSTHDETLDRLTRNDQIAGSVFSTWVVIGLFVDGWAHNAGKPEDFWTPWHAILYSGFVASVVWFTIVGARRRTRGHVVETPGAIALGFGLFAVGGVLDGAWHTIFGVEEDVEALLSPTHLTLMTGGLLLVTEAVRTQLARREPDPSWSTFWPAALGLTLTLAIVAFFTQFAAAFGTVEAGSFEAGIGDDIQSFGVVAILLTNALLLGAVAWTLRHWRRPPAGTFTLIFSGVALLLSGLEAFDQVALVGAAAAGGLTADLLVRREAASRVVLVATPLVLWAAWFAIYAAVWEFTWTVELWTGSIFLAILTGSGLSLLATPRLPERSVPAETPDTRTPGTDGSGANGSGADADQPGTPALRPLRRALAELLA